MTKLILALSGLLFLTSCSVLTPKASDPNNALIYIKGSGVTTIDGESALSLALPTINNLSGWKELSGGKHVAKARMSRQTQFKDPISGRVEVKTWTYPAQVVNFELKPGRKYEFRTATFDFGGHFSHRAGSCLSYVVDITNKKESLAIVSELPALYQSRLLNMYKEGALAKTPLYYKGKRVN